MNKYKVISNLIFILELKSLTIFLQKLSCKMINIKPKKIDYDFFNLLDPGNAMHYLLPRT